MAQQLHYSRAATIAQNKDIMSKTGRKAGYTTLITYRKQIQNHSNIKYQH